MVRHGSVVNRDCLMGEEDPVGARGSAGAVVNYDEMEVEEEPSGARGSADSERPVSEKDKEDFAGASGAARSVGAPAAEFVCDFCSTIYAWRSDIARVEVHGDELRFHKRSDTTRTLQACNLAAQKAHYTGVTRLKDICFRCAGRRMFADEDKYVDRAKSGDDLKIKQCWKRMSDESRNAPGPAKAAKQLGRIQVIARQMQDEQPEKAQCFETLSKLISLDHRCSAEQPAIRDADAAPCQRSRHRGRGSRPSDMRQAGCAQHCRQRRGRAPRRPGRRRTRLLRRGAGRLARPHLQPRTSADRAPRGR